MNLNDLLKRKDIDPQHVLVLRHRPNAPELNKVLPWLAAEKPNLFNAYQQTAANRQLTCLSNERRNRLGQGQTRARVLESARRRSPERSWWRRAHRNEFPIVAVLEDSALEAALPEWDEIEFTWEQLQILPTRLTFKLPEWRGVYYIFDISERKGYVGSAYGESNLLGRWLNYAELGHGGNRLLLKHDPHNFRFTILRRVSPDLDADDVIRLESSWKRRLHTRHPNGLNDN